MTWLLTSPISLSLATRLSSGHLSGNEAVVGNEALSDIPDVEFPDAASNLSAEGFGNWGMGDVPTEVVYCHGLTELRKRPSGCLIATNGSQPAQ
jgi:hypothetical protein